MNGFLLFTFTASIAVSCMALALAIASQILHKTDWGVRYIVFQSCLIGIMVMYLASKISLFFMPENLLVVFNFIFKTAMMASMSFVIVYLPFFLSWVIAKPWRKVQMLRFTPLAMTYFGIGLAALIVNNEVFSFWVNLSQTLIFLGMYVYCIITLWVNLKSIEDQSARGVALSINIVSLSLIPLSILSLYVEWIAEFSYPIYVLAFSIIIIVYNYIRFGLDKEKADSKPELNYESLSHYKISEREFTVVQLICEGYTNKEIAQELSISVNTVNNHVANIFSKMGVRSRIDLLKALKEGPWS
ncbi:MAG: response regulator transcription factor [Spirochaetales bacterium]|nr:response regulator transcription factor [Spirochaetales bacterium]